MSYEPTRARQSLNPLTDLAPTPSLEIREGKRVKVRLLRSLFFGGTRHDAGDVVTVGEFDALDLRALGRGEIVE